MYAIILLGWIRYDSPLFRSISEMQPRPTRAKRPLPVTSEFPQCATFIFRLTVGRTVNVRPVQASKDWPVNIQSVVPSKCTAVIVVFGPFVEMSAVTGVVDVIIL